MALEGPLGRREVGLVELVLGRIAGPHGNRALLRQEEHHPHAQHGGDLIGGRPEHVIEGGHTGELAAERIERLRGPSPGLGGEGLRAHVRSEVRDQQGDDGEEDQRRHIGRVGDGEGVKRGDEEEIVAQRCREDRDERRPEAETHGNRDHRRHEHKVDILQTDDGLDGLADAERGRDGQQRGRHTGRARRASLRPWSERSFAEPARRRRRPRSRER